MILAINLKSLRRHQWRSKKKLNGQREDTRQRTYSNDYSSSIQLDHGNNEIEEANEILLSSTHICRIKGCGGAGWPPPPIIFERLKLPQQIIYRRKENLSESPNHQKYWENILVSRFYEQFSRNRRNLGHFRKFEKISNSQNMNILHITYHFESRDLEIPNI